VIIYGYTASRAEWVGVSDKEFWDYLKLLIVPTAIAFGVAVLNWMQTERARKARIVQEASERKAEADIRERERKAEENRSAREREAQAAQRERELEVENQRAQDEALQAYLDQISRLLLDKQQPLLRTQEGKEARTVARARTLTALTRLDGSRKRSVLQFLYEARLVIKDRVVVDLKGADLSGAHLSAAELSTVNLSEAALSEAYLNAADLRGIDMSEAALSGADLREAILSETNLSGANLEGAIGIANEELQQQAYPLDGATMPNGQKYEDWIKTSKDGHGKDEENSGLS